MKRALGVLFGFAILLPSGIQGQTPEVEKVQFFVGEWTYEMGEASGRMEFEFFGDHLLVGKEVQNSGSGDAIRYLHVMGYDAEGGTHWWQAFVNSPSSEVFRGSAEGNTWTWVGPEEAEPKMRFIIDLESDDLFQGRWERSVEGGPWEVTVRATATRVR
jgi:hypothetical protein